MKAISRLSVATALLVVLSATAAADNGAYDIRAYGATGGEPRLHSSFNADWLFRRQSVGAGALGSFERENGLAAEVEPALRAACDPRHDDRDWQRVHLPHTWNAHDVADERPGYWRGIGWYRKHFQIEARHSGKRVFLEFEGANQTAELWLNGKRLGSHKGGYTGFTFDLTDALRFAPDDNVLTVKVDNLYDSTIPPTVKTDYSFYGGIYRDVWLRICDQTYIDEVAWKTPHVSHEEAELAVETRVVNAAALPRAAVLVQEILDSHGGLARTASTELHLQPGESRLVTQTVAPIEQPVLWSPDQPRLYQIRTTLRVGPEAFDAVENPLGFRWYRFDPQRGFFLNGERVQLQGTNWHQFYPGLGSALPNSRHVKDMELIREMGANFWRTSHYPHDPTTLEASDRLGLLVWDELPLNKEIGDLDRYLPNASAMAEEMVKHDRNHPSLIVWGMAGEVNVAPEIATRVTETVAQSIRSLDPSRPVGIQRPRTEEIARLVDVVGQPLEDGLDGKHVRFPERPYLVAEYSASTMGRGIYGMGPESEDLACLKHEKYLSDVMRRPWLAGSAVWHQFDYEGETYDTVIPHIVAFGMTDSWRIPKDVFYFYQSQWSPKPMVHIVGHWTWTSDEGKAKSVKVYSNADEVELLLNGRSLGFGARESPERAGLSHPPSLWEAPYEPGKLEAVARNQGAEVARDERRTAGPAHGIALVSDVPRLAAGDPESIAYLTATIVDKEGVVVPSASHAVTFTSYGPGELLEQTWPGYGTGLTWPAIAGKTVAVFRATARTGTAVISAWSPGLRMGRVRIKVVAEGKPDEMQYRFPYREVEVDKAP